MGGRRRGGTNHVGVVFDLGIQTRVHAHVEVDINHFPGPELRAGDREVQVVVGVALGGVGMGLQGLHSLLLLGDSILLCAHLPGERKFPKRQ